MPTPAHHAPAAEHRFLLVEDDVDQRELIVEVLESHFGAGCCETAATCGDGERRIRDGSYALVLLDVNLPDGSGLDLLGRIRRHDPGLAVMMLTGENDTTTAKEAIRRGACDYVVKAGAYLETVSVAVAKNLAAAAAAADARRLREAEASRLHTENATLAQSLSEVQNARATAEREASVDPMTGCYNRRAFERVGTQMFAEAYRSGDLLALVMIDLDRFKIVNDTLGHAVGDELIRAAARSIVGNMRQMDVACRWGGDEFVILLPQTSASQAAKVATRIANDYGEASAVILPDGEIKTMSLGIAELQETHPRPANVETLMLACDRALYRAKAEGRGRVCAA